jgi:type II secretory pathway component PulF
MNPYESPSASGSIPSSTVASKLAGDQRSVLRLPSYVRAAVCCIAWLLPLGLMAYFVPRFEESFNSLRERAELPALTEWLLWFALRDKSLFYLPSVLALVLLVCGDFSMASCLQHSPRKRLYWIWFGSVVFTGLATAAVVTTALLLPLMKMNA